MTNDILKGQITFDQFLSEYNRPLPVETRGLMGYPHCPKCKKLINDVYKPCPFCGQALDWTEYVKKNGEY